MWRKGLAVIEAYPEIEKDKPRKGGRGVSEVSYAKIAKITGRDDHTIKKWVELVKKVGKSEANDYKRI